ncbi:PIN domain-containing protein [Nocardiopsis gilva YIM 90087]|uniref:Ribonuclease VapC n=1 Tax=Nocardiopsis gilva YIM 90087 TaxID=1235441 RepID=A0A223S4B3_9ACTN|nr:type II toxin-antitoxin system VapC family toxin [Nocardiopsis gilva]ASU82963.1 PIN domain-containing protein [Nocardiopsis gilva YIM 90087]
MSYLVDTNVISELRKSAPDPRAQLWRSSVSSEEIYTSVLVIGEIRRGIERLRRRDPAQADAFDRWLDQIRVSYSERVLPITNEIAEEWARMNVPDPMPVIDGLLAASAKVHGLTLVTRNTKDVMRPGVNLFDPVTFGT